MQSEDCKDDAREVTKIARFVLLPHTAEWAEQKPLCDKKIEQQIAADKAESLKRKGKEKVSKRTLRRGLVTWSTIEEVLSRSIPNSAELVKALVDIRPLLVSSLFDGLVEFLDKELSVPDSQKFFTSTLPGIQKLALEIKTETWQLPLLSKSIDQSVSLTQKQCAILLANAFFSTYPSQQYDDQDFNDFNFYGMFCLKKFQKPMPRGQVQVIHFFPESQSAKLRCLLNYFDRVLADMPKGSIHVHRQVVTTFPDWGDSQTPLHKFELRMNFPIEAASDCLQADFANKYIGGSTLGFGAVQEEIRFVINPECLTTQLFCGVMEENEAIIIRGVERFSNYRGYGNRLQFDGNHDDKSNKDSNGDFETTIVAIDALPYFRKPEKQFERSHMERELRKCYAGLVVFNASGPLPTFATGNWGCGAFGGDLELKCLLQWIAASEAGRDILYLPFIEKKFGDALANILPLIHSKNLTAGQLWHLLLEYPPPPAQKPDINGRMAAMSLNHPSVFKWLARKLTAVE